MAERDNANTAETIEKYQASVGSSEDSARLKQIYQTQGIKALVRAGVVGAPGQETNAVAAGFLASVGEKDAAFAILNKAYDARSASLLNLKYSPSFDNLRSDPRHADLVRRIGFPE